MKEIDLNKTLFDLTEQYPELIPVLAELGFAGVTNEAMRTTHGKIMTIVKGAEHHGTSLETIRAGLARHGFSTRI